MAILVISQRVARISLFRGRQKGNGRKIEEDTARVWPSHKTPLIENLVYSPSLKRQREDKESGRARRNMNRGLDKTVNDRDWLHSDESIISTKCWVPRSVHLMRHYTRWFEPRAFPLPAIKWPLIRASGITVGSTLEIRRWLRERERRKRIGRIRKISHE